MADMPSTSERIVIDQYLMDEESYRIFLFHWATYLHTINHIKSKKVLDFGCGSGYGANILAEQSEYIIGVDTSHEAIRYAIHNYSKENLSFINIDPVDDGCALPFINESFDVVISFQVIEHLKDTDWYLREVQRLLRPGGMILLATPNREGRLFPFQKPWNIWHEQEYSSASLQELLNKFFSQTDIQYMGGDYSIIGQELRRTKFLKWITLPLTLPIVPDIFRKRSLRILKQIRKALNVSSSIQNNNSDIDTSYLTITGDKANSVNIIAMAKKGSESTETINPAK